jgi:hypothetical protein
MDQIKLEQALLEIMNDSSEISTFAILEWMGDGAPFNYAMPDLIYSHMILMKHN